MNPQRPRRTAAEQAELDRADRRQFWIIAAVFAVVLVVLTGLYAAVTATVEPRTPAEGAAAQIDNPALAMPNGGAEPTDPGDRGGSQQLGLLIGLIVILGAGAAWVVHSSRKARRRLAGGADGTDGDDAEPIDAGSDTGGILGGESVNASAGSPTPR